MAFGMDVGSLHICLISCLITWSTFFYGIEVGAMHKVVGINSIYDSQKPIMRLKDL